MKATTKKSTKKAISLAEIKAKEAAKMLEATSEQVREELIGIIDRFGFRALTKGLKKTFKHGKIFLDKGIDFDDDFLGSLSCTLTHVDEEIEGIVNPRVFED